MRRNPISVPPCLRGEVGLLLAIGLVLAGAGCSTPPKIVRADPEIERNVAVARGAYAAGSTVKAADYYRRALRRARVMDAPLEIARNAYNLAACLAALNTCDEARDHLDEARLEFRRAGVACPELPLLEAKIARAQGQLQEAENLARTELRNSKKMEPGIRIQWQVLLAELLCDLERAEEAETALAQIPLKQLKAAGADIQAQTALARARAQMLKRNPAGAARQFDDAAQHLREAGRYADMAGALEQAGQAYENAGDGAAAADRLYRAARSLFESSRSAPARDLVVRALPIATASNQPDLQYRLERLKAEIEAGRQTTDN